MIKKVFTAFTAAAAIIMLCACGEKASAPAPAAEASSVASNIKEENADDSAESADANTETNKAEPESIGNAYFTPGSDGINMLIGEQTLHAYFEASDVIGAGTLTIMNADSGTTAMTLDLTKACETVTPDDISTHLSWENGTHLLIHMDEPLDKGYDYYVTLSEGAFRTSDGTKASKALEDASIWHFSFCDYGIALGVPNGSDVFVEDRIPMTLYVEGEAEKAVMESFDENRVRFDDRESDHTKETTIKIHQIGEDSFTVTFYDRDHTILGKIPVSYNASMPPEPEEEIPEHSVIGL